MHHPYHFHNSIILLIAGVLLLTLGRKLFWVCVAVIGFVVGADLAPELIPNQSELAVWAVAICLGLIGALLAIFVQELTIAIAGFFLGGELSILVGRSLAFYNPQYMWIIFAAGGIVGAILLVAFFDWALIFLSSLAGAELIMNAIHVAPAAKLAGFVVLAAVGVLFQAALLRRRVPVQE